MLPTTRVIPIFILASIVASAQEPPRGHVSGLVRDADTGSPLSAVDVEVSGANLRAQTDAQGRYEIDGVAPGAVQVSLRRVYTNIAPPFVSATVRAGQRTSMPELRVRLEGRVSGRVLDDQQQPVVGATVFALTRQYSRLSGREPGEQLSDGRLWDHMTAVTTSDDHGRYTFPLLGAGRSYYLLAKPPRASASSLSDLPDTPVLRPPARSAMYYPSQPSIDVAFPSILTSREERSDVDIVVPRSHSFCVAATLSMSGSPAPMQFAVVEDELMRFVSSAMTNVVPRYLQAMESGPDGRIRVCGLPEGSFTLLAGTVLTNFFGPATRVAAGFRMEDRDLDLGMLSAEPPIPVTATVVWDAPADVDAPPVVRLTSMPPAQRSTQLPAVVLGTADTIPASFQFEVTRGVLYGFGIAPLPPPFYLADVRQGGISILGQPFVGQTGPPVEFVIARDGGSIVVDVRERSGEAAPGVVVVLVRDASAQEGNIIAGTKMADDGGRVTFAGLPPRTYRVVAMRTTPPAVYTNSGTVVIEPSPEAIAALGQQAAGGERVNLRSLATATVMIEARD